MATLMATREQASSSFTLFEVPVSDLGLRVERTDISFENVTSDEVRITVHVTNKGTLPSPSTEVQLASAPLGAFLTWQPLQTLAVPALLPQQSADVSGLAGVPRPPFPLGRQQDVTPALLQAAISAPAGVEALSQPDTAPANPTDQVRRSRRRRAAPMLAPDPFALLGRGGIHWAGNIDVLMRRKAVERHLAQALRVYPGKTNMAMFFVGDRKDGYRFDLTGMANEWQAELLSGTSLSCLRPNGAPSVVTGKWMELSGSNLFFLLLRPPHSAERGEVQVHVERQSDGKEAIVEFSLDCQARGSGCYTV